MDTPGKRLQAAMSHAGISGSRLAESYGCSGSYISGLRLGRDVIGLEAAARLSSLLDVPAEWLLEGRNAPQWAQQAQEPSPLADMEERLRRVELAAALFAQRYIDAAAMLEGAGVKLSAESIQEARRFLHALQPSHQIRAD